MSISYPLLIASLGPGSNGSITQNVANALQEADLIYCPGKRAAELVESIGIDNQHIIIYSLPMSPDKTKAELVYNELANKIEQQYCNGQRIAIVAEGDASVFSSTANLIEKLNRQQVEINQLPGIPAFVAAASLSAIPLAQYDERLTVCPNGFTQDDLDNVHSGFTSLVVMKVSRHEGSIKKLIQANPELHYHYYENVDNPQQFYTDNTDTITKRTFPYFALMIIKQH